MPDTSRCANEVGTLLGIPILVGLYLLVRGTHALIKCLALRAGVRSQDTAFFIGFYLTPAVMVGLFVASHFLYRWAQEH